MGNCLTNNTVINQTNIQPLKEIEERDFEGEVTYVKPFYKGIVVRNTPTIEQLEEQFVKEDRLRQIKKQLN